MYDDWLSCLFMYSITYQPVGLGDNPTQTYTTILTDKTCQRNNFKKLMTEKYPNNGQPRVETKSGSKSAGKPKTKTKTSKNKSSKTRS